MVIDLANKGKMSQAGNMWWGSSRATLCDILHLEDCYFGGISPLENMFLYLILV